jgi:hypothetical protein
MGLLVRVCHGRAVDRACAGVVDVSRGLWWDVVALGAPEGHARRDSKSVEMKERFREQHCSCARCSWCDLAQAPSLDSIAVIYYPPHTTSASPLAISWISYSYSYSYSYRYRTPALPTTPTRYSLLAGLLRAAGRVESGRAQGGVRQPMTYSPPHFPHLPRYLLPQAHWPLDWASS